MGSSCARGFVLLHRADNDRCIDATIERPEGSDAPFTTGIPRLSPPRAATGQVTYFYAVHAFPGISAVELAKRVTVTRIEAASMTSLSDLPGHTVEVEQDAKALMKDGSVAVRCQGGAATNPPPPATTMAIFHLVK